MTATDRERLDDPRLERGLTGDLRDRELVREALRGVEALVRLAAIPQPDPEDPAGQFTANCHTAYLALDEAGRAGVRRALAEVTAPLSRFAGLYDTSRCARLLGFSPAHRRRTADAGTEDTR
ncbi:hypothetical protein [Streptomyces asiaticus]